MNQFDFPSEAKHYLLLQRTGYQTGIFKELFRKARMRNIYDKYLIPYLDTNSTEELSNKYHNDLKDGYDKMSDYLPSQADNILDIGCGLGGINLFLNEHYDGVPNHYLLDKNEMTEIFYMFNQKAAAYNSLETTEAFLRKNGIEHKKLKTVDISTDEYPLQTDFDLIISLLSWGFHYPVDTYLEDVKKSLSNRGVVIIDIRKSTDGMEILNDNFEKVDKIMNGRKRARILAQFPY